MRITAFIAFTAFSSLLIATSLAASPTFVGKYSGINNDSATLAAFRVTQRGVVKKIRIVGLAALCQVFIPGEPELPAETRSTNITMEETPEFRLPANSRFDVSFNLIDQTRIDFRNAEINLSGRIRGGRGTMTVTLSMDEIYEDNSREVCSGSVRVPLRFYRN